MFNETFKNTKQQLDNIGCGFCLAKWTQTTLHLQVGQTHSCHHPTPHKVELTELSLNPSSLHNSVFKKRQRKMMLEGERPDECNYCWNIEDNSNSFSDRVYKSSEPWSIKHYEEIKNMHWRENFNPRYVEVSFSNHCNFKCSYCGPTYSSQWVQEIEQHGGYPTSTNYNNLDLIFGRRTNALPYLHSEVNPYVDAFWEWWPDLYKDLHTFRITGGEPLLTKDTFRILDYIIETKTPNKNLNLCINTNLSAPTKIFNQFVDKIEKIIDNQLVYEFIIFTSVDTWGKQAEYIRHGLDFNLFWERLDLLLDKFKTLTIDIMSTYNALSVPNYKQLMDNVYILKKRHHNPYRFWGSALLLDSSYLRWPPHQTVKILDNNWGIEIDEQSKLADFYEQSRVGILDGYGFTDIEINKIKRIKDWFYLVEDEKNLKVNRKDFYQFITEHDNRRGTKFENVFPELKDFLEKCKSL